MGGPLKSFRHTLDRRIKNSYEKYGWTPEQQEVFNRFMAERYANYSNPVNTIRSYLDVLNRVVEHIKKPFSDITIDDLLPILTEWQQELSPATMHGWRSKLRAFLRWESGDRHDPRAEKIRPGSYVSPVRLEDLLTDSEIEKLRAEAKENPRDLAMLDFHLLWGPRPGESAKLKIVHVKVVPDKYILVNIPQGKTDPRPVPIPLAGRTYITDPDFLDSALNAYMSMVYYLNIHPGYPDHPEYPLWYNTADGHTTPLSKEGVTAVFRRLGRAAGLKKPVTTYVLRRTAFNRFAGADREKLTVGFGWRPGSKMPTHVYNKLRPQDVLSTLIKEEENPQRDVRVCPRCQRENPKSMVFCGWCGAPLVELPASATLKQFHADQEAQEELTALRDKMAKVEELLSSMVKVPGFEKVMEEAVTHSE